MPAVDGTGGGYVIFAASAVNGRARRPVGPEDDPHVRYRALHMAALSQSSLGLDDLEAVLAGL
ncbi:hypothetical protein [Streptomyces sp. NPDC059479]|uniref:hypothetical protein n=1 Tax=Streptomyces sp. NPDC059479 TaxID=3346848 RepID=UPI003689C28F